MKKLTPYRVTLLERKGHLDKISIELGEDVAREIHGVCYEVFKGAYLSIDVTAGRGRAACRALGIEPYLIDVINVEELKKKPFPSADIGPVG
jgi:hypothetical protein